MINFCASSQLLYIHDFLIALTFTDVVELVMLFIMLRKVFGISSQVIPNKLVLFTGLFASFSTITYVWFVFFPLIGRENVVLATIISESVVVTIEAIFYFFILRLSPKKAFLCSFVCNMTSFTGGLIRHMLVF